jgi:hypothetical protein
MPVPRGDEATRRSLLHDNCLKGRAIVVHRNAILRRPLSNGATGRSGSMTTE